MNLAEIYEAAAQLVKEGRASFCCWAITEVQRGLPGGANLAPATDTTEAHAFFEKHFRPAWTLEEDDDTVEEVGSNGWFGRDQEQRVQVLLATAELWRKLNQHEREEHGKHERTDSGKRPEL